MSSGTVVVYVEDPGTVNVIAPVLPHLQATRDVLLLSAGHATSLLAARGIAARAVQDQRAALAALQEADSDCLVVGVCENPQSLGHALVHHARAAGGTIVGLVDYAANAGFRFKGDSDDALAYAPDWLLVPDSWTAQQYEQLGFSPRRIEVVGHPHYDAVLRAKRELQREGCDHIRARVLPDAGARPIIVFVSEISTGLNPVQYRRSSAYTLAGRGLADGRTEIVLEELLDALAAVFPEREPAPYLVLRRHPKEQDADLAEYRAAFDAISVGGDPLPLIFAADLVVGLSSMLLMESFLLGVETLSVLPRESERDWLPVTRNSAMACATTRTQLRATLARWRETGQLGTAGPAPNEKGSASAAARIAAFIERHAVRPGDVTLDA